MPKDYARYVNKKKHTLVKRGWRKFPLVTGSLLVLLSVLLYSIYVFNIFDKPSYITLVSHIKTIFTKTSTESPKLNVNPTVNKENESDIQFSFYTSLPTMQVPSTPNDGSNPVIENKNNLLLTKKPLEISKLSQSKAVEATKAPETVANTPVKKQVVDNRYLLQIAAFRNPTAAGDMRISLLLAGFEVEIVKAVNHNQQIYQLQQGPFATIEQVKAMQRELKKKGIESVIVKRIA